MLFVSPSTAFCIPVPTLKSWSAARGRRRPTAILHPQVGAQAQEGDGGAARQKPLKADSAGELAGMPKAPGAAASGWKRAWREPPFIKSHRQLPRGTKRVGARLSLLTGADALFLTRGRPSKPQKVVTLPLAASFDAFLATARPSPC